MRFGILARECYLFGETVMTKLDAHSHSEMKRTSFRWSQWLWRPWYAKAWLIAASIFWLTVLFSPIMPRHAADYFWLAAILHPYVLIFYIACRAAWFCKSHGFQPGRESGEQGFADREEMHGMDDWPLISFRKLGVDVSDPRDPGSPLNRSNILYKLHHDE
ncbi:hypothetical protein M2337_002446 [Sphingobium sp. B2D3A]|nr:hypothetical protein [Sphingobium sp. B2D3A]